MIYFTITYFTSCFFGKLCLLLWFIVFQEKSFLGGNSYFPTFASSSLSENAPELSKTESLTSFPKQVLQSLSSPAHLLHRQHYLPPRHHYQTHYLHHQQHNLLHHQHYLHHQQNYLGDQQHYWKNQNHHHRSQTCLLKNKISTKQFSSNWNFARSNLDEEWSRSITRESSNQYNRP